MKRNIDWHEKPPAEVRSVGDALRDADRLRRELPLIVQVYASDWDKVILADEVYRLREELWTMSAHSPLDRAKEQSMEIDQSYQGTCEQMKGEHPDPLKRICNRPAVLRYPAMGGGYMRLCEEHGEKHRSYCERWDGTAWTRP